MTVAVQRIVSGRWKQNGYVLANPEGEALIIDPGSDQDAFETALAEQALRPLAIVNTHGHFDHIGAVAALVERYGIPFWLHRADWPLLRQANFYKTLFDSAESIAIPTATGDLADTGAALAIGGFSVEWLATPGHTRGSVCLRIGACLFSGDTMLPWGSGRTDLPGACPGEMAASFRHVCGLPVDLQIYPGHGRPFRLGDRLDRFGVTGPG
jgi:hydroxyacylglutathione hydrolase